MSSVTVRTATPADLAALGRYGGALMRQHHAFDPARFISVDRPEEGYGRFLVSQLSDPEVVVLVAEREGAVIGYCYAGLEAMNWMELRPACGFVHDVFVDEAARGAGAGEALVRAAIAWLQAHGSPRVMLWTAVQNASAQRLFAKLGFATTMLEMSRPEQPGDPPA